MCKASDVSPAQRGRNNEGKGPVYRSRLTARLSCESRDLMAETNIDIFSYDGRLIEIQEDFLDVW